MHLGCIHWSHLSHWIHHRSVAWEVVVWLVGVVEEVQEVVAVSVKVLV